VFCYGCWAPHPDASRHPAGVASPGVNTERVEKEAERGVAIKVRPAYLDEVLSLDEYRRDKNELVKDRRGLEDQVVALEKNRTSWLEPAICFVVAAKQAGILAETGTDEQKRDFLKTVGSNLTISNRHLEVIPRGAWKLVVDQGSFAHVNTALVPSAANSRGELHHIFHKRRRRDSNPRDPCGPTGFQDLMTLMTLRSFLHFTLFHTLFIAILLLTVVL
jgi:hypothetical protein